MIPALQTENLGKRYKLGLTHVGSLRELINRTAARLLLQKPASEPNLLSSEDVSTGRNALDGWIWALRNVSFEVQTGEVVGVIGRNGAGKSTLLKILSRVTCPTTGRVEIQGRVGSLLEVGTGFHPELTGRENVFLNGVILGMTRSEIRRKFDAIVDFAEIGGFLDTPVKRYSSGMYIRLAFAVAAHLEPEILLVDEVLSVGDVGFQQKCLGKMDEVAKEGRTVLFVSHNMQMIRKLCRRGLFLHEGSLALVGGIQEVLDAYSKSMNLAPETESLMEWRQDDAPACEELSVQRVRVTSLGERVTGGFAVEEPILVEIDFQAKNRLRGVRTLISLTTDEGTVAFHSTDQGKEILEPGLYRNVATIPGGLLNHKRYLVGVAFDIPGIRVLIPWTDCLSFRGILGKTDAAFVEPNWPGALAPALNWSLHRAHGPLGFESNDPSSGTERIPTQGSSEENLNAEC